MQGGGVVNVNPTANQSPDPGQGGLAVNSPINAGHGSTLSEANRSSKGSVSQTKTCLWHSFSGVTGTRTRVTLKLDWTLNASINASAFDEFAGATASYDFKIEYSLDNGSTWTVMRGLNDSVSIPDGAGGSDSDGINTFGSESVDLPNPGGIDITQIRVRDRIFNSAAVRISNNGSASSNATASVSLIRLEVDTVPVITGVSSSAITHNSATISWTTNEPADSQVEYGTTTAYGQSTALDPALVTAHSQGLSGLTPGTLYHYRVKSRDATGNLAVSDDFSFTTSSVDTTAPVISNVAAGGITATTATITWTTNENSDSQVEYGTTTAYGQSAPTTPNPALVTSHSQGLFGLTPGTLYHYRVKSRDAAGNLAVSGDFSFTTVDATAPVISKVAAGGITVSGATITWTTNENSDSQVEYGTTTAYGQSTALNPVLMTAHLQVLSGLTPGTLYHYRVKSRDAVGNLAVSGDFTFTTAQNGSAEIKWLVTDHLGSTRMVIDETGSLAGIKRHDFAPFGEELYAGIRRNGTGQGQYGYEPPPSNVRQKFGLYERDGETGLDYAQARYFSSSQGRFTSTDPLYYQVMMAVDPQQFNLYAYARNNPLKFIDPNGERLVLRGDSGWLVENVLNRLAGELFNDFFYIENGEVFVRYDQIEAATHQGPIDSGVALLLELVESQDTYLYFAGDNNAGETVADLFTETRDARGNLNRAGREIADKFTGNTPGNQGGTKIGTRGRLPGVAGTQPANLANGDPVFAVIAYNTNMIQVQTGFDNRSLGGISGQISGEGQRVQPVSLFIHESTENLKFRQIGRFTITISDYVSAHFHAQEREAVIRKELGITGGFAGGALRSTVPRSR